MIRASACRLLPDRAPPRTSVKRSDPRSGTRQGPRGPKVDEVIRRPLGHWGAARAGPYLVMHRSGVFSSGRRARCFHAALTKPGGVPLVPQFDGLFPTKEPNGNAVRNVGSQSAAAPATVSGEPVPDGHWVQPGKAVTGGDPRARRPTVDPLARRAGCLGGTAVRRRRSARDRAPGI